MHQMSWSVCNDKLRFFLSSFPQGLWNVVLALLCARISMAGEGVDWKRRFQGTCESGWADCPAPASGTAACSCGLLQGARCRHCRAEGEEALGVGCRGDVSFPGLLLLCCEVGLTWKCGLVEFLPKLGFWMSQHRLWLIIRLDSAGSGGHPWVG